MKVKNVESLRLQRSEMTAKLRISTANLNVNFSYPHNFFLPLLAFWAWPNQTSFHWVKKMEQKLIIEQKSFSNWNDWIKANQQIEKVS